jgi:hypothetical protein
MIDKNLILEVTEAVALLWRWRQCAYLKLHTPVDSKLIIRWTLNHLWKGDFCLFSGIILVLASTNWRRPSNFLSHFCRCEDLYLNWATFEMGGIKALA